MGNDPLSSTDQSKLLVYGLLLLPAVALFGLGLLPVIFIAFGITMLKRNGDFSHIVTATKITKGYFLLVAIGWAIASIVEGLEIRQRVQAGYVYNPSDEALILAAFAAAAIAYIVMTDLLFFQPLKAHREWVAKNAIFSSKLSALPEEPLISNVDIIKGERLKSYSVADELIKWAQLKEAGHISNEEFQDARKKLLHKS